MFEQRSARLDEQGKEARACEKRELGSPRLWMRQYADRPAC